MDGKVVIGTEFETKEFDAQIKEAEAKLELLEKSADESTLPEQFKRSADESRKLNAEIEKTKNKIKDLKDKRDKINPLDPTPVEILKGKIDSLNNGLSTTVSKVGKWALGILAIESAYGAVRSAMGALTQYDDQMSANISYIQYALASVLKPVIETILNLVVKLLQYINYIAKAWTGKELFSSASAFKSMVDSSNKTAKKAKEIKNTLAGFDEMNVLSDNSSKDNYDTSSGGVLPSIDLNSMEGEVPAWLQWIADNKDTVLGFFQQLVIILGILGLAKLFSDLVGIGTALSGLWGILKPVVDFVGKNAKMIGGVVAIVGGLILIIDGVVNYLKDPTWENFSKILAGIIVLVTGVAILFGGIPALATAIIAIVAALGLAIYKHWDEIKGVIGGVASWINDNIIKPVVSFFSSLWNGIINGVLNAVGTVKNVFWSVVGFFGNIINKILNFFRSVGVTVGNVIGSAFKGVVNGVLRAIENILNFPIRSINRLINVINKVPGINLGTLSTFSLPRLAKGGIINQPGRGVPIGSAIAGERGQEGVIPLTDSQQMELLGQAIGKYITLNATVPVYVGNRQIAREIRKINADSDFAFNR